MRDRWFGSGRDAFKTAFPAIAEAVGFESFYVCPICQHAFSQDVLPHGVLTREDVPPRSVGGKPLVLTCRWCNSRGGHELDHHAGREADVFAFFRRELKNRRGTLTSKSGTVPIRLCWSDAGLQMFGNPRATRKESTDRVTGDFEHVAISGEWRDFRFRVGLEPYSRELAAISWLRSGFLAFFAALGYRFIYRREMEDVRLKIVRADRVAEPTRFRLIQTKPVRPMLLEIAEPNELRSFAMLYGHNAVFYPAFGDGKFYPRLAICGEKVEGTFSGTEIPWPVRPVFALDFVARRN